MSFFIPDYEIDKIIEEDVNPVDLTSHLLSMNAYSAKINYSPREDTVICCTEEVERLYLKLGLTVESFKPSGTLCKKGEVFFTAHGSGDRIHLAWRNGLRIFESFCGLSTRAHSFVQKARAANPKVNVVTTRKSQPGTKKLAIKAVMSGGAYPHRLGLSESILIFGPHIELYGGEEKIIADLEKLKIDVREKRVGIEAKSYESAIKFVKAGFDFVQLDKFPAEDVAKFTKEAKEINNDVIVVAAGNIKENNVEEYAKTGADVLVTSALYFGPPADIKAEIRRL